MRVIFDTAAQPFDQYQMLVLPGAAMVVTLALFARSRGRRTLWIGGGITLLLFLLTFVLPLADHHHMQALARSPDVRTVEGPISVHSRRTYRVWLGSSRGVGVGTSNSYRTQTDEQFYIGPQWFAFTVGDYPSTASFTNIGDPPVKLADGMWAKASFIADPWYQDELRIVRLSLGEPDAAERGAASGDPAFAGFWTKFAAALERQDQAGVRALTRFPFLFAGSAIGADRFETIWMALFVPPTLRQCLARAMPARDGEAMSVGCGAYVYVFERGAGGWRFAAFTADPEAM